MFYFSTCVLVYPPIYLPIYLFINQCVNLSSCPPIYLRIFSSIYPSFYAYPSVYPTICLSMYPFSLNLSLSLPLCPSTVFTYFFIYLVCLAIYRSMNPSICGRIWLVDPPMSTFACLFCFSIIVCLSYLSTSFHISVYLSIAFYPTGYVSICAYHLPICLSTFVAFLCLSIIYLSIYLPVYLSVCLSILSMYLSYLSSIYLT